VTKRPKSDYSIQTVLNALRVLEAFHDEETIGVTRLAERRGLHKNNVFRLLATLEEAGYVEQIAETERYRLGVSCLRLGQAYARTSNLVRHARPELSRLAVDLGETTHIGILRDFEVVHLDGELPNRLLLTGLRVGDRLPAHCTSLGKVLLGCALPEVRESFDHRLAESPGLVRRTHSTIVDRDKLFEHLRAVAGQGYAVDLEECELALHCAAVPVHDANGAAVAALSVSGPAVRLGVERVIREVVPALLAAAERISHQLGHRPALPA
jgi:DNA-binding IclR family transcriptional regulator